MHAILVTFTPKCSEEELMQTFGARLKETKKTSGLIMKTFVESGPSLWGGFYLFTDKETADAYLSGEFFTLFSSSELLSDVKVAHYVVDDGPSMAFGTPSVPLAESQAA